MTPEDQTAIQEFYESMKELAKLFESMESELSSLDGLEFDGMEL